jgi:tetratricopeptide (TPR) repeat protein
MTETVDPLELVHRGQAAARIGYLEEARELLRRAVDLDPRNAQAWLALAGVEEDHATKMACLENVLALDPDNAEAHLGLEMLESKRTSPKQVAQNEHDELEALIADASRRLEDALESASGPEAHPEDEVLYCANHPTVETMLRCNRCGKPICTRCVVRTPVGYRCQECVGEQQAIFFTGGAADYVIGGLIALVAGGLASFLMALLSFWFFALILGPTAGVGIAEMVRFSVRRRRSRYLWLAVGAGMIVGSLPVLVARPGFWALLTVGLFLALAVGAAVARLR